MKIELVKNENGKTVGWQIIAENMDEKLTLGTMRNMLFYGLQETRVEYNGCSSETIDDKHYVKSLHFATLAQIGKEEQEMMRRIEAEGNKENL